MTSGLHNLGIGPGSGCDQGGNVGRRGNIPGGWIIGRSIGAWVREYGVVVGIPEPSNTGIWHRPAGVAPSLVDAGENFDAHGGIIHGTRCTT